VRSWLAAYRRVLEVVEEDQLGDGERLAAPAVR
jgi:hypothetical protein